MLSLARLFYRFAVCVSTCTHGFETRDTNQLSGK
jgi:hypothetical protein